MARPRPPYRRPRVRRRPGRRHRPPGPRSDPRSPRSAARRTGRSAILRPPAERPPRCERTGSARAARCSRRGSTPAVPPGPAPACVPCARHARPDTPSASPRSRRCTHGIRGTPGSARGGTRPYGLSSRRNPAPRWAPAPAGQRTPPPHPPTRRGPGETGRTAYKTSATRRSPGASHHACRTRAPACPSAASSARPTHPGPTAYGPQLSIVHVGPTHRSRTARDSPTWVMPSQDHRRLRLVTWFLPAPRVPERRSGRMFRVRVAGGAPRIRCSAGRRRRLRPAASAALNSTSTDPRGTRWLP